ncbi:MAG: hypothetical protein QG635_1995, partial [Bacteroidota bacterium]|nr:hypothetical protein [Bacteroidota bacterium]
WNESGGGTMFPKSIAQKFRADGNYVAVFFAAGNHSYSNEPYLLEKSDSDGIKLYGVYNRPRFFLDEAEPNREIRDERIVSLFKQALDEFQPDIVHFHNFLGLSFAIADEVKHYGIPSLFTTHNYHLIDPALYMFRPDLKPWDGTDFFKNSPLPGLYPDKYNAYQKRSEKARSLINENIDITLAISTRVKDIFTEFGATPDKIAIVHQVPQWLNGLLDEPPRHEGLHNPLRFGFIGSIIPHKGVHIIIGASRLIKPGTADFRIYGLGNEEYRRHLINMDFNKIVYWKGAYNTNELPAIAGQLDAMIIPSIWEEGAGLVVLESLAMKLPVIGANIGGIPDFIHEGVNGKLYQYDSDKSLASTLNEIAANPQELIEMQNRCRLPFRFDDYIAHLLFLYSRLISRSEIKTEEANLIFKEKLI